MQQPRPDPVDRSALEAELATLATHARERRSVDEFARAALEGFLWAVGAGVCGKLLWDSAKPPLFFWTSALFAQAFVQAAHLPGVHYPVRRVR